MPPTPHRITGQRTRTPLKTFTMTSHEWAAARLSGDAYICSSSASQFDARVFASRALNGI